MLPSSRFNLYLILCLLVPVLLSGCGSQQKVPDEQPVVSPDKARLDDEMTPGQRIAEWERLIRELQASPVNEQLESVNQFFNRLKFVDDIDHWGKEDYWATPEEFLASAGGDCEDFSIAKYFTLKQLNVPDEHMRITYVKSLALKQPHMVLSYYPDPKDEPLVLDNVIGTIVPASERLDLIPVYSFNIDGLWLAKRRGAGERAGEASQVGLWRDFLKRMEKDNQSK